MRICQYESHDFRRRPGHPVAPLDGQHAQGPRSRSRKAHAGTGDTAVEGSRIQRDNGQYPPLRGADIDFLRAHDNFGTEIHISDERGMLLDTGGGIKKARPFLDGQEPFLVHNADILTDIDLAGLYRHHLESDAESTLLVSERKTSRYLLFDDDYHLHGWINKSTGEVKPAGFDYRETKYRELAFGGIHIISPSLFHLMDDGQWNGKFSIIPFYLSACTKVHIQGYPLQGFRWFDIGKPETLAQAEEYYKQK